MNRTGSTLLVLLIALIGLGVLAAKFCFYTISEWEQAVITQFGEVMDEPKTEAGLYFKMPYQKVERFDKRLMRWDGSQTTTITRDRRTINIDVTARWRIEDARRFRETIRSTNQADSRLNGIIEGAIKDEIAKFDLFEVVRSSNRILEDSYEEMGLQLQDETGEDVFSADDLATLGSDLPRLNQDSSGKYRAGRPIVLNGVLDEARRRLEQVGLGVHLEDVLIIQLGYIREIEANVYAQMNSELQKIAAGFRSSGQQRAEQRLGEMERELSIIDSSAVERSQGIRGSAEAQAIAIYAEAYNEDTDFYQLLRSLEAYEKILGENTSLILSSDTPIYQLLKRIPNGPVNR